MFNNYVMHFRPYLYEQKFSIIKNHKPLIWMNSIKDASSKILQWKLKLSDFEFQYMKFNINKAELTPTRMSYLKFPLSVTLLKFVYPFENLRLHQKYLLSINVREHKR